MENDKPMRILNSTMIPRGQLMNLGTSMVKGKIARIYFPEIKNQEDHHLQEVPRSIGLAHLMEQSMDQWDPDTWQRHLDFLDRLAAQVKFRSLELGSNLNRLPTVIDQDLKAT